VHDDAEGRRRLDGEAAWMTTWRGGGTWTARQHGFFSSGSVVEETGRRRPDPRGGERSPGEKKGIGPDGPVVMGSQMVAIFGPGPKSTRGVAALGKLEDLRFSNEPLKRKCALGLPVYMV
jgi:hypothetical protein